MHERPLKKTTTSCRASELAGRTAIVTGSTSGIGLGIARGLAEQGADILLNGFGKRCERGALWTRSARRRHQTRTNFARDLLPGFGLGSDMLGVEFIEHQVAGFQLLVVTRDAILIDERAMPRGLA
jgi:NAD(P)-dependent dehydrogenase (short-subunit alcohol dehydrogenase family)